MQSLIATTFEVVHYIALQAVHYKPLQEVHLSRYNQFKYLMIKSISGLSDVDLVDKCMCDMSYKYFLGLAPEDGVIESSTLSKFRRMRLKDMNLLDMLINKSIDIAREKGIEISNKIIVDSTHSLSRSNPILPANALQKQAKILRKSVYEADPDMKDKMPQKYEGADLEKQMDYVSRLLALVREQKISILPSVSEKINLLSEMIEDINKGPLHGICRSRCTNGAQNSNF